MSCLLNCSNDWEIRIPNFSTENNFTVYNIHVRVGAVSWVTKHRYSDFVKLHEVLNLEHGIPKDALPPKKVIGNLDPAFIQVRRVGLEKYINFVFNLLQRTIPKKIATFLRLDEFDILFILQKLSEEISSRCAISSLRPTTSYKFSLLQVYAISQRLKMPCPQMEGANQAFSNILDLCEQLSIVTISGESKYFQDAKINRLNLPFDLICFKRLSVLYLIETHVENLSSLHETRQCVTHFKVERCRLRRLNELLLCDEVHKDWSLVGKDRIWTQLKEIDLSCNELEGLDGSVSLIPTVTTLNLSYNKIQEVPNISSMSNLEKLSIQSNGISCLINLKTHLPVNSLSHLDLSENHITSLKGLESLISLVVLNLSSNSLKDLNQVSHISSLPKIESIVLTGNPMSTIVDYRVKVLEKFGARYNAIRLDNEESTQKELDTVAVLQALRVVREGKMPSFAKSPMQNK